MTTSPEVEHEVAIGLGSNLGSSIAILQAAWQDLLDYPGIDGLALSSPYRSQPVGMNSDHWFVNAAALVRTRLAPYPLLRLLHAIEARRGRVRHPDARGYQDRTLDLDLLLYDALVLDGEHLTIPHPRMDQRLFVLAPLAEIAGERIHPRSGKTIGALLSDLQRKDDQQRVRRISWSQRPAAFIPKEE